MRLIHFAHKLTPNIEGVISEHDLHDGIVKRFNIDLEKQVYEILHMSQSTIEVSNTSRMIVTTLLVSVKTKN